MKLNRRHLLGAMVAGGAGLVATRSLAATLCGEMPALLPHALAALELNAGRIAQRDRIGIVNFSAHSRLPRFQLIDLQGGQVLKTMLVAHGSGSDPGATGWTERFSNRAGSNASSKGVFVTGQTYVGKHGRSRKLIGLEPQNEAAERRAIVIHGADYVSQGLALEQGRIGRSQGCFAVSRAEIGDLLEMLGEGRMLYAWKG
ncbi:MAG TPA: murein L,D-transpeptidase catalytic domain family protein [Novosphingobium sp.]|nr:murein L,D-transpeptidase catalytic domain family protein [Novosphingobium sp.]